MKCKEEKKRTEQQNRALHLYFKLLAEALNEAGLDMKAVLKPSIQISWTPANVKEYLWRPFQKILVKKNSTTELDKMKEIDLVYENINRHLAEKFGVSIDFPSIEGNFLDKD